MYTMITAMQPLWRVKHPPVDETSGGKLYLKSETEFNNSDADASVYSIESSDPIICRFINADGYCATGIGITGNNVFAYCNNNPVMCSDPTGNCPKHTYYYMPSCPDCNPDLAAVHAERGADWAKNGVYNIDYGFTYSRGIGASGNLGFLAFTGQGGVSVDAKGNVGIQFSVSYSVKVSRCLL